MTTVLAPLGSLVPVSHLVHRVLDAASAGVSEGSRRNARAALEARDAAVRQGLEVVAPLPGRVPARVPAQRALSALPRGA